MLVPSHTTVALARAAQSLLVQQAVLAMQLPLPADAPAQNFSPAPQVQVLSVQVAVPPQSVAATSQQPALPLDWKPHAPAFEQVRAWQPLPAAQSVGRQQPAVGTQRPPPADAPEQNLWPPPQPQTLLVQVAVPPQSLLTLQHGAAMGAFAWKVQVPFWQLAFFWQTLAEQSPSSLQSQLAETV